MDECDCNYPECMACFERRARSQIEYLGGADKELYYEWLDLKSADSVEDHAFKDCDPKVLEDIIKNPNSW